MMAPPDNVKLNENGIPDFDALPLRPGDPHLAAWGLYGADDQLGFLNRQTDERVAEAARSEIRTGVRISLNWPLNAQGDAAFFGRKTFHHRVFDKAPRAVHDDEWAFNSQVSSQWDGLRHYGYQGRGLFYNGVTAAEIQAPGSAVNGVQAWAARGIVGRAVLADVDAWRRAAGRPPADPFDRAAAISAADLRACLDAQGTRPRFGDVLLVRSGWMAALAAKSPAEIAKARAVVPHTFGGVERSRDVLRWIWDNFSAVAGDQPSFESWPPAPEDEWSLHEVLLAGWGCPIGELFDLEALAEHCSRVQRWSFFIASEPCNVVGGVASPPNILAIF